jgi:hypothetical protein
MRPAARCLRLPPVTISSRMNSRDWPEELALIFFAALYVLLKLPTVSPWILFIDDGETLYHALSILAGRVPYRDDISHHFLGYVLPFVIGGAVFNVTPYLLTILISLNQVGSAFILYRTANLFVPRRSALISGALVLSAREPWVISFFPLYEVSFALTVIWYFSLRSMRENSVRDLSYAWLSTGVALLLDQRAVFVVAAPLAATLFLRKNLRPRHHLRFLISLLSPPSAALLFLYLTDALVPFIEQTIIYPLHFRTGGALGSSMLESLASIHKPLVEETPLLLFFGVLGGLAIVFTRAEKLGISRVALAVTLSPAVFIPLLGGRNFSYYTITWLPLLSLLAIWSIDAIPASLSMLRNLWRKVLWFPVVVALILSVKLFFSREVLNYSGDGVNEVVDIIEREDPGHAKSVFVWGYRPDYYVYAKRLSPFPFVNRQMIHPDAQIEDASLREAHVYPKYEKKLLNLLSSNPPDYIIQYILRPELSSETDKAVSKLLTQKYSRLSVVAKPSLGGETGTFEVYKRL